MSLLPGIVNITTRGPRRRDGRSGVSAIAILSHIVIDEIHRPGAVEPAIAVGGAGAYAAVGASLASSALATVLISGVGAQDREFFESWCRMREIDPTGLFPVSAHSPRTRIDYREDGERVESPVFGTEHFDEHTPLPIHIPFEADELCGVYLFHDDGADYWRNIAESSSLSAPLLWEISAASCRPDHRDAVRERAPLIDVLSINAVEAASLFGTRAEAISELRALDRTVLLRLGAAGSVVIERGRMLRVAAAPTIVSDPTGGGNSYSGAFLAAFAASGDPVRAAQVAAAAAGMVISQSGAPLVDDGVRARVAAVAETVPVSLTALI
jgi:sugar/nucleoside kinase (ribokinase family)